MVFGGREKGCREEDNIVEYGAAVAFSNTHTLFIIYSDRVTSGLITKWNSALTNFHDMFSSYLAEANLERMFLDSIKVVISNY